MSYLIQINEDQRVGLLKLIQDTNVDQKGHPLEHWEAMLAKLPQDEAESPKTIHGFCL